MHTKLDLHPSSIILALFFRWELFSYILGGFILIFNFPYHLILLYHMILLLLYQHVTSDPSSAFLMDPVRVGKRGFYDCYKCSCCLMFKIGNTVSSWTNDQNDWLALRSPPSSMHGSLMDYSIFSCLGGFGAFMIAV